MFKPKTTHQTVENNDTFPKRMTFLTPEATKTAPSVSGPFREKQKEILEKEKINTGLVKFNPNFHENLKTLAQAAYKNSPEKAEKYENTIKNSLIDHLQKNKSIEDLWGYLQSQGCTDSEIKDGILQFFRQEEGKYTQIKIRDFLNLDVPASTKEDQALDKSLLHAKNQVMLSTINELKELLTNIKAKVPNLPPAPPSILS